MTDNKELKKYFDILCNNDYPFFIEKYLETKELKRLKKIGQFCGCDYNKLYNIRYWYSRYDHSIATALITWNFTKNKTETLAALFHDLGTPAFSHCVDFMLGDSINQETSEKNVEDIINDSEEIKKLLMYDGISIKEVSDTKQYSIIENKSPKLCADRLEGVLHTVHIWLNIYTLKQIEEIYKGIDLLVNEENKLELGFKDIKTSEKFFKAAFEYSIALQKNEDRFTMQYIAESLKNQINKNNLNLNDLYIKSEQEIIEIIDKNDNTWNIFKNAKKLQRTNEEPKDVYYVSLETKKRYVIPLCKIDNKTIRLDEVSNKTKKLLKKYKEFKDTKYSYIKNINR